MIKPPSGDQGLTFLPHALQIVLFEPFMYEPTIMCETLQIVSLQLAPSVGRLVRWPKRWNEKSSHHFRQSAAYPNVKFH